MKSKFYLLTFIILIFHTACKDTPGKPIPLEENAFNNATDTLVDDYKRRHNYTLSQIKQKSDSLIEAKSEQIKLQLQKRDFKVLYKNADSSLTSAILESDIKNHFDFVEKFYGKIKTIKDYGSIMTAEYRTNDYTATLIDGDSLRLRAILALDIDDAKLSYLSFLPYENKGNQEKFRIINDIMNHIIHKDIDEIYTKTNTFFKEQLNKDQLKSHINKYVTNEDSFKIQSNQPLIFTHNKIGLVSNVDLYKDTIPTYKVKIAMVYESEELKLEDIQFKSIR